MLPSSMRYCVHLFPVFPDVSNLHEYRKRFDPLASKILPHITLVFPFGIAVERVPFVLSHVQTVADEFAPFALALGKPVCDASRLVYLPVEAGESEVCRLHDTLYTKILAPFLRSDLLYSPHLTVGRVARQRVNEAREAFSLLEGPFTSLATELIVEAFGQDEVSETVARFALSGED